MKATGTLFRYKDLTERQIVKNRTTLRRWMDRKNDPFPAAIPLGDNSIAWRESEVLEWLARREKAPRIVRAHIAKTNAGAA